MKLKKSFKYIFAKLSNLNLFFWTMIGLMIATVIGTIEQKNIGLFAAQEKYFASLFYTYYGIPLPGGGALIIILTLGLLSQLFFKTSYKSFSKSGIMITHIGALILLIGSFITYLNATEGSLVLKENESKNEILDYRNYDLVFTINGSQIKRKMLALENLDSIFGSNISVELFPNVELKNIKIYNNCNLIQNSNPNEFEVGFAKLFKFTNSKAIATEYQNEKCVELSLFENDKTQIFRIFLNMAKAQSFKTKDFNGYVSVENKKIQLPFSVKLIDFDKKFHQGTMISKSFKSLVEINDGNQIFNRLIEMNAPLRYKGYTFYQSSFSENSEGEMSELAVVQNTAQWFPYVSSFILCFGILWHLVIVFMNKREI